MIFQNQDTIYACVVHVGGLLETKEFAKSIGGLIGLATETKNGLMPAGGFVALGDKLSNSLEEIRDGYGYAYGDSDGSSIYGPFISVTCGVSKMQLKADHMANALKFRVKRADGDYSWSAWKSINIS